MFLLSRGDKLIEAMTAKLSAPLNQEKIVQHDNV
jgi:hypothetical protein